MVRRAAFSPDGTRVVTASDDGTARLWDAATGKEIAVLRGHDKLVRRAAFSPDGTRVVTASNDNTARLWDAETGKEIVALRGHDDAVVSAAFSPDGTRVVTASNDNTARLWDVGTIPKGNIFQVACAWLPDHDLTDIAVSRSDADSTGGTDASPAALDFPRFAITPPDGIAGSRRVQADPAAFRWSEPPQRAAQRYPRPSPSAQSDRLILAPCRRDQSRRRSRACAGR